jgi:ribulose-5-phosphate 4-epimerase/fuculose-1-phosphate aldolase
MRNDLHEMRTDLAAALRWAARLGLNEGVCNHFSLAVSEDGREFLVNPQGLHWSEVRASDIVLCNDSGRVLDGAHTVEATAFHIHAPIHRGNPRARAVLHTHMSWATSITVVDGGRLEMVEQNALRFHGRIAYDDDYGGVALDGEEGERIARALDGKDVAFLAHHGVVVTGPTMAKAFDDLYYLERACQNQVLAMSTGRPLKHVPAAEVERTRAEFDLYEEQADLHFAALKRMLDREEPDYAA